MDQLVALGEELDFANPAAAALEIEAGAEALALRIMIADQPGDRLGLADRAEIERAAPDERMDRLEEIAAERAIAGGLAGANEGGALPRQRGGFVIADRRIDRQRDRGHFRRRPKPQVDAKGIAFLGPFLEQLDKPLPDPERRLAGILARAPRQRVRIVEKDEIDVGGIIELVTAQLAERDHGEAAGRRVGGSLGEDSGQRPLQRPFGKRRKLGRHPLERKHAGQVADTERQRESAPLAPDRRHRLTRPALRARGLEGVFEMAAGELRGDVRKALELHVAGRANAPAPGRSPGQSPTWTVSHSCHSCVAGSVQQAQRLKLAAPMYVNAAWKK